MDTKAELWLQGLEQGRLMHFRPRGGSMAPFLRDGDIVSVASGCRIRPGNIILFQRGEDWVMHRVVARYRGRIITKGDALSRMDRGIEPRAILGRAVSRRRDGKECRLDSPGSRILGLAFSLTTSLVPTLLSLLVAMTRLGREKLGLAWR